MDTDLDVKIVVGPSNPHMESLKRELSPSPFRFHILASASDMAELMSYADLAIGACGSTTWERCCLGLPSIVVILADNQREIVEILDKEGALINLSWHEDVMEMDIKDAVEKLLADSGKRKEMSLKGREMVDGLGAKKVAEKIQIGL